MGRDEVLTAPLPLAEFTWPHLRRQLHPAPSLSSSSNKPRNWDSESRMAETATMGATEASPSIWRWFLGFLMVGACWGLTTPFMRRAAVSRDEKPPPERPFISDPNVSWLKRKVLEVVCAVLDLLKNPAYAVPLLLNVTGSVWFFLLIGQAGKLYLCENEISVEDRTLTDGRAELDSAHYEFAGLSVHRAW